MPATAHPEDTMKKIGIVGGVGWPSTMEYYRLICAGANDHFRRSGATQPLPTPPIAIESLVMSETRKLRAGPGEGDAAWARFDAAFRDALFVFNDPAVISESLPATRRTRDFPAFVGVWTCRS